jgi:hypothetical protein
MGSETKPVLRRDARARAPPRELLRMKLKDFLEYSGLDKAKANTAYGRAGWLVGNLCSETGTFYDPGMRKVKDLYSLTVRDFLDLRGYGVKTIEALSETLTKYGLPPLERLLTDISSHPSYRGLRRS